MDEKVLDAQKWVNATYASVSGYKACPETGRNGWSTMNSLIMGLQHELGISPVVASFGPGTMAKLQAIGDIGFGWSGNSNIVRIIQHGLFCKGYRGADGFGEYGAVTTEAVKAMRVDMGLPDGATGGQTTPALFKCVLNMDAYVTAAGGTDEIRAIQRWLNGRYWQKSAFSVGPCDGIYARDVQKALMTGLQYELGLATPNGNFGPATQSALRTKNLGLGDSGVLVEMFSAACVLNSPVPAGTGNPGTPTTWRNTFDAILVEWVQIFQRFSKLPDSGRADYQTWAQLLVSMGDADRPATGSDTRFEITASRAKYLRDNGYQVVGRYLYDPPGSTLDKEIKPGELATIFSAGLNVFPIYQDNARQLSDFTYTAGYQHALNAHSLASGYGFNRGTTIYFAVDYDAVPEEIDSAIVPYFHGVAAGLAYNGKRYIHGVYGSRNVCTNVAKQTGARYSFVSGMSWGFAGNLGFPMPANWAYNQIKEFKVTDGSDAFDLDRDVVSDADPGQSSVNKAAVPADGFIDYLARLLAIAKEYGKGNPDQLVMEYVRHKSYGGGDWDFLIGGYDGEFVNFANGKGMSVMEEFKDPYTGHELGAEHLMASTNGHFAAWMPSNPRSVGEGDVAGWGGDLLAFYADWRHATDAYPSGHAFAMAKLAKVGVASSFGFNDLIEDADAWLLADAVRNHGKDIVTAVTDLYNGGGGLRRFQRYWAGRFNGNTADAKFLAHNILTASDDKEVVAAQLGLITYRGDIKTLPAMLGYDELEPFEQGFVDTLLARTGQESRMAATYRKNHDTYLRAARSRAAARATTPAATRAQKE